MMPDAAPLSSSTSATASWVSTTKAIDKDAPVITRGAALAGWPGKLGTHERAWILGLDPRAKLIRCKNWGPWLTERRVRLRCGLQVELGVADPEWVDLASADVLRDGCRVLHDPHGVLARALAALERDTTVARTPLIHRLPGR